MKYGFFSIGLVVGGCASAAQGGNPAPLDSAFLRQLVVSQMSADVNIARLGPNAPLCLGADSAEDRELRQRLSTATRKVVPASECRKTAVESGMPRMPAQWYYVANQAAVLMEVSAPTRMSEGIAEISGSYHIGPLNAAGFICTLERQKNAWAVKSCTPTWVS
jgi:hypothetical protein